MEEKEDADSGGKNDFERRLAAEMEKEDLRQELRKQWILEKMEKKELMVAAEKNAGGKDKVHMARNDLDPSFWSQFIGGWSKVDDGSKSEIGQENRVATEVRGHALKSCQFS